MSFLWGSTNTKESSSDDGVVVEKQIIKEPATKDCECDVKHPDKCNKYHNQSQHKCVCIELGPIYCKYYPCDIISETIEFYSTPHKCMCIYNPLQVKYCKYISSDDKTNDDVIKYNDDATINSHTCICNSCDLVTLERNAYVMECRANDNSHECICINNNILTSCCSNSPCSNNISC